MPEQGTGWTLDYYRDRRGRSPVEEFIDGLDRSTRAKVFRGLEILQSEGASLGMPQARSVTGYRFRELRVQAAGNSIRVFYFLISGRRILLLHAFSKKTQQTPRRELDIAAARLSEAMERRI